MDAKALPQDQGADIRSPFGLSFNKALVPFFSAAILTSAFLLFAIQPMFTKLALPLLGGAPNVWNTALVFFQGVLLCGYLYAHLLARFLPLSAQIIVHGAVLCVGFLFLPIAIPAGWTPPVEGGQGLWLLGFMAVAIGAPFFALSANAPLLQRWFSHTDHHTADDPYYLYAASNIGSLSSLLAYPVLIEPQLGLSLQSWSWGLGYFVLVILILSAAVVALLSPRHDSAVENTQAVKTNADQPISMRDKAMWLAFAIPPSGLMLSVTTHLTTNVSPAPFLWIIPLSLYLLTFIVVFSSYGERVHKHFVRITPLVVILGVAATPFLRNQLSLTSLIHLSMFFLVTMALHGALASRRPPAAKLTEFYLWMSLGGVIGGVFTALLAPVLFTGIWEYPILLAASGFILVATGGESGESQHVKAKAGLLGLASLVAIIGVTDLPVAHALIAWLEIALVLIIVAIAYYSRKSGALVAVSIGALWIASGTAAGLTTGKNWQRLFQGRSFFGVLTVERYQSELGPLNVFIHGKIIHNMQLRDEGKQEITVAYFSKNGPYGDLFGAQREKMSNLHVGVIGLGAGALACHAEKGETWRYYEIDPNVVSVATDPRYFSFIERCTPDAPILVGDGRLHMAAEHKAGDEKFDVLVLDAFSSDSIPGHLVTKEAIELYTERVKSDGLIFFHTSNRYLDVTSVAIRSAQAAGLDWRHVKFVPDEEEKFMFRLEAVVMGKPEVLEAFNERNKTWARTLPSQKIDAPWTDDYQNVIGALMAKRKSGADETDHVLRGDTTSDE